MSISLKKKYRKRYDLTFRVICVHRVFGFGNLLRCEMREIFYLQVVLLKQENVFPYLFTLWKNSICCMAVDKKKLAEIAARMKKAGMQNKSVTSMKTEMHQLISSAIFRERR